MRGLAAFVGAAGLVASVAGTHAQDIHAQDTPPPHLEGAKAMQAITGMTISATGQNGPVVMFIGSDNTLDTWMKGRRAGGRWSFKDNCFRIEHESGCAKVDLYGTQGTLNYDGNIFPFTAEPGNQVAAHAAKG